MNKIVRFDRKDDKNVHIYISAQVIPDAIHALYSMFPNANEQFEPTYHYISLWKAQENDLKNALDIDDEYLMLPCILSKKQIKNVLDEFKDYTWEDGIAITHNILKHQDKDEK